MTPKKIAAFALGPLGGALLSFITLPIITWHFSQEDIGRLAMLTVVTSFSTLLFSFGLDQAYVREFHEVKSKSVLFKITLLPGLLLLIFTLVSLLISGNLISRWLFELESQTLSLLVAAIVVSTFVSRFLSLILRMYEQGIAYSMSQLLPKLLLVSIIGSYVVFSVDKNITNLVLANGIATLFVCFIYGWNTRKEWIAGMKEKFNYAYLHELLKFGVPFIFSGLAFWGLTATDKILLKSLSNFEQLGLYTVAVSFAAIATIFQGIFATVWAPTVYKWAAEDSEMDQIEKVIRFVLLVIIILFCLVGFFSWILIMILPSMYDEVQWLLISCVGFPLFYTLSEATGVGIGISRRSIFTIFVATFAFILNFIGNWLLVPYFGASGAAASTCIAFWVLFLLKTEFSIYLWKPLPRLHLYGYSSLLMIGAALNTLYGKLYQVEFTLFWVGIMCTAIYFFKQEISEAIRWVKVAAKKANYL